MGLEIKCRAKIGGNSFLGQLHIDSRVIQFSCADLKWSHPVGASVKAKLEDGTLTVGTGKSAASFELGEEADRWLEKVLNPPSRMKKLGIKQGLNVFLQGEFDDGFRQELESVDATVVRIAAKCSLAIAIAETTSELKKLTKLVEKLSEGSSIWILWPKGKSVLKDSDVIFHCKELGMGPGKSCAFDDRLTGMRFTKKPH